MSAFVTLHWLVISYILLAIGSNIPKWSALSSNWKQAMYQWFYDVVMSLVNRHSPPVPAVIQPESIISAPSTEGGK